MLMHVGGRLFIAPYKLIRVEVEPFHSKPLYRLVLWYEENENSVYFPVDSLEQAEMYIRKITEKFKYIVSYEPGQAFNLEKIVQVYTADSPPRIHVDLKHDLTAEISIKESDNKEEILTELINGMMSGFLRGAEIVKMETVEKGFELL